MHLNWIDYIIIVILIYSAFQGWEAGLVQLFSGFISFIIAIWLAIKYNGVVAGFLAQKFGVPTVWATIAGYIIVGFVVEALLSEALKIVVQKLPNSIEHSWINNWLGALLSAVNGFLIIAFFLLIISILPLRGTIKNDIKNSTFGGSIISFSQKYDGSLSSTLSVAKQAATKFFTIDPGSTESITLDVSPKPSDLHDDETSEAEMVGLVNNERMKVGVSALIVDVNLTAAARSHSRDMFMRQYFSHYTPEGKTPSDRIIAAGVHFTIMGENIAYTPDLPTAHTGLMNSPEHKKNILDPQFHRVGIGIISTDSFGMMVTQDFAN